MEIMAIVFVICLVIGAPVAFIGGWLNADPDKME